MLGDLSLPCLQLTHTCSLRVREGRKFDRHQKTGGCRLDGELSSSHSHTHLHPSARLWFSLQIANSSFLILESTGQLKHLRVLSLMWQKPVTGSGIGEPQGEVLAESFSSQVPYEILLLTLSLFPLLQTRTDLFWRLKYEGYEFKASLGYSRSPVLINSTGWCTFSQQFRIR